MPELPEVETIRIGLASTVLGKTISEVKIRNRRVVVRPQSGRWPRALKDQTIRRIARRGKFLVFTTDSYQLLVHLGMTGQLTYWDKAKPTISASSSTPSPDFRRPGNMPSISIPT